MTGARFAEQLEAAGLDASELAAKAALFDAALAGISRVISGRPAHASWVPGRLEVFGTHTDYAGGRTLVAALPRGFAVLAAPRTDDEVHVLDAATREHLVAGDAGGSLTWRHYVDVVVRRLERNFPGARRGATIAFASDLPPAAGMSSSSALIVGIAGALEQLWDLRAHEHWPQNIAGTEDQATFLAAVESGKAFARLPGDEGVGTHGGSEDHAAMLLARPQEVTAFSFLPLRRLQSVVVPEAWRFVVASSGVASEKTRAAREPYNRLSRAAAELLDLWNRNYGCAESLAAALESRDAFERLRRSISESTRSESARDALLRRLEHFRAEDGLVLDALRAFQNADPEALGQLSYTSQRNAEALLQNQIPETVSLVRAAQQEHGLAARSFGAGFGGSVWAIVERERAREFSTGWLQRYRREYPRATGAASFIASPGPPLTRLACS